MEDNKKVEEQVVLNNEGEVTKEELKEKIVDEKTTEDFNKLLQEKIDNQEKILQEQNKQLKEQGEKISELSKSLNKVNFVSEEKEVDEEPHWAKNLK